MARYISSTFFSIFLQCNLQQTPAICRRTENCKTTGKKQRQCYSEKVTHGSLSPFRHFHMVTVEPGILFSLCSSPSSHSPLSRISRERKSQRAGQKGSCRVWEAGGPGAQGCSRHHRAHQPLSAGTAQDNLMVPLSSLRTQGAQAIILAAHSKS